MDLFNDKTHSQYAYNWLWKFADADNKITEDEKKILNGFATMVSIEGVICKDIGDVALSTEEIYFCLREMYRFTINSTITDSEEKVIDEFIEKFKVPEKVVSGTKKWIETLSKAEADYKAAIN